MNSLLKKINVLNKENNSNEIYRIIIEQLNSQSDDIELWLSLALVVVAPPLGDEYISLECIQRVLDIDDNNAIALLISAHIYEYELGGITDELLDRIENLKTSSNEVNAMLKYVSSWAYSYHKKNNPQKEETLLIESIRLCQKYVWNYVHLAKLYLRYSRKEEVNNLIYIALKNVKKIYTDINIHEYNITDVNDFLNTRIKGTYLTDNNIITIKQLLS